LGVNFEAERGTADQRLFVRNFGCRSQSLGIQSQLTLRIWSPGDRRKGQNNPDNDHDNEHFDQRHSARRSSFPILRPAQLKRSGGI
jgi:hypothetical protein